MERICENWTWQRITHLISNACVMRFCLSTYTQLPGLVLLVLDLGPVTQVLVNNTALQYNDLGLSGANYGLVCHDKSIGYSEIIISPLTLTLINKCSAAA